MNLIPTLSTHIFAYRALDEGLVGLAAERGFPALEIFAAPQHLPLDDGRAVERAGRAVERAGMALRAVHAPFYRSIEEIRAGRAYALGDRDRESRALALAALRTLLRAAEDLGSPDIVLHMGHGSPGDTDAALFADGVAQALGGADSFQGRILLENTPRAAATLEDLAAAGAMMDAARTGFCLDLGHLHLSAAGPADVLEGTAGNGPEEAVLGRVRHVHVHDNGGEQDEHLPPGTGTIDWERVMTRLAAIPHEIGFSLEISDQSRGGRPAGEVLRECLERIEGPVRGFLRQEGIRT